MSKGIVIGFWGTITLIELVACATASLLLMFNAGRNQQSIILLALFTGWVLSPYAALIAVTVMSSRWSTTTRTVAYGLMVIVCVGSLVCYGGGISVEGAKPAFMYLMVPLISWVLMFVAFLVLRLVEGRNKENRVE